MVTARWRGNHLLFRRTVRLQPNNTQCGNDKSTINSSTCCSSFFPYLPNPHSLYFPFNPLLLLSLLLFTSTMTSTGTTEEDGVSMRASALAQFTSDSPVTPLSTPNSDPLLSPLPSPVRARPEHPKSPCDNPITNGGHSKNKNRPYPLSLIPFDLSEPYEASEYLTIRPYDEICKVDYLGQDWVDMYEGGMITNEQNFDDRYFRPYLGRFIEENGTGKRTAFSHQANLKAVFYDREDEEWAKLDLVDEYRRQTGKVLGVVSHGLCRN